jgi:hypothetical protein
MTKIRYIGVKPVKFDNVADTGLTWNGAGDVHEVSDPAKASKLLANSLIWDEPSPAAAKKPEPDAGKTTVQQVVELDALRERATALGVDVKGTWGIPRLTKAIEEAEADAAKKPEPDAGNPETQA